MSAMEIRGFSNSFYHPLELSVFFFFFDFLGGVGNLFQFSHFQTFTLAFDF